MLDSTPEVEWLVVVGKRYILSLPLSFSMRKGWFTSRPYNKRCVYFGHGHGMPCPYTSWLFENPSNSHPSPLPRECAGKGMRGARRGKEEGEWARDGCAARVDGLTSPPTPLQTWRGEKTGVWTRGGHRPSPTRSLFNRREYATVNLAGVSAGQTCRPANGGGL